MSKSLFSGKLSNGVTLELLEAETFTGNTEIAVKIAGEIASISVIRELRTGDISVKTTCSPVKVKSEPASPSISRPTLDDVA